MTGSRLFTPTALAVGIVAAAPSIWWGVVGADYLSDDFLVANRFVQHGMARGAWDVAFVAPVRPGAVPYFVLLYQLIGEHPLAQALVLAALNAFATVLIWLALRCVVSEQTALIAAFAFAAVPNRGATRLWFVAGSNLLALACVAAGAVVVHRTGRVAPALALLFVGIVTYEGVSAVAALVLILWWAQDPRTRMARTTASGAILGITALALWVFSPKRDAGGPGPFEHARTITSGVLGEGLWGGAAGAAVAMGTLMVITVALALLLPSFRRPGGTLPREIGLGACFLLVGAIPFMVGGAPFAVRGIFDRNNVVPDLGVSLIIGAVLAACVRRQQILGALAAVVVTGWLAANNMQDVRDYHAAVTAGHDLVDALVADVDPSIGPVVVVPPLPGDTGVDQFILGGDLTAAMELRYGPMWATVQMPGLTDDCGATVAEASRAGAPVLVYDRLDRSLMPAEDAATCAPQ